MAMAGVLHLWNEWEVQILVLVSFALQVFLLSFAWMRRRSISRVLRVLLWLMYLMAEYIATYTLGHMSISGKASEHQQLMAFWAPLLLMHLGGQDTITAYAMEDSQLWLRHLLTFAVQALGAGYVLYKYIGSSGPLVMPAVLMFTMGVLKNAERVWALSFSRLEIIRRYLDGVSIKQDYFKAYPGADCLLPLPRRPGSGDNSHPPAATGGNTNTIRQPQETAAEIGHLRFLPGPSRSRVAEIRGGSKGGALAHPTAGGASMKIWEGKGEQKVEGRTKNSKREKEGEKSPPFDPVLHAETKESITQLDDESVLQGAHDLLYICMGQFVDDKIWPSEFQRKALEHFHENGKTFQLVEMQLSMMYDIFYTKAAVIHTWFGRCFRAISLLGTAMVFFLFQFSTGKHHYNRVDDTVTYILVAGAFILEAASLLRAMGSTWTCALLREREWAWLHRLHVSLRRYIRIAQGRRWSDSIGQLNLLDSYSYTGDETSAYEEDKIDESQGSTIGEIIFIKTGAASRLPKEKDKGGGFGQEKGKRGSLLRKMMFFWRHGGSSSSSSSRISSTTKELVLQEIQRLVEACEGEEGVMRSYRGQCVLEPRRPEPRGGSSLQVLMSPDKPEPDDVAGRLFLKDLTRSTSMEFDQSILTWHLATHKFLRYSESTKFKDAGSLVEATKAISDYMMFLLVECPYMLPSPVRSTLHLQAKKVLREPLYWRRFITQGRTTKVQEVIDHGAKLADQLLQHKEKSGTPGSKLELLRVVFGVWVEMLCYAAHHCSRESHARQLNNGGEFLTTVWLLTTAEFNRAHYSLSNFRKREHASIWKNFMDYFKKRWLAFKSWFPSRSIKHVLKSCWSAFISWYSLLMISCWSAVTAWYSSMMLRFSFMECVVMSCSVIFSLIFLPIRGIIFLLKSPWIPEVPGYAGIC